MNFIKKLFGFKFGKAQSNKQENPKPEIHTEIGLLEQNEIDLPEEVIKGYDISEIKKQSTQVKNKDGLLASINFIKDFIAANEIEFKELISLLKKVIPYMKKEKTIEDLEIISYLESQVDKYPDKNNLVYQADIADLYGRVDNKQAIEFLEAKLGDFETDNSKTVAHFDSIILLSDCYLKNKEGDRAFQSVQRAELLLAGYSDKFDFLTKQVILSEQSATICLQGQKNPNHAQYLYYEISAFILYIAKDINAFPQLSGFFYRKQFCLKDGWGFEENEDFDDALMDLNIFNHKQKLLKDIYSFAFNELPIKMGIPKTHLKKDLGNDWQKLNALRDKYRERPFDMSIVYDFVGKVINKYQDKVNN